MSTIWRFVAKFASLILCTLHCFDRVIFKGHLALAAPRQLEYFVDCVLKVRPSDFMKTIAPQYPERLVEHAQRWAHQVNPLLRELFPGYPVHWVTDQAEFATDLLFTSREALAGLYRKLLDYAVLTFTPKNILGFLGRKCDRRFDGEVQTEYQTDRWPGARIKHRMRANWLKMYDKFGLILRVETVINAPQEFSVYRTRHHT